MEVKKSTGSKNDYSYEEKIAREREFNRRNGGPFVWGPLGTQVEWPPREMSYSIIAKCYINDGKIGKVNFVPCVFDDDGYIHILKREDPEGCNLFDYMKNITKNAYMTTEYAWDGDEINVVL